MFCLFKQKPGGFSLAEALIVVAVIAVLSLAIGTAVTNLSRTSSLERARGNISDAQMTAQRLLNNASQCANVLRNASGGLLAFTGTKISVSLIDPAMTSLTTVLKPNMAYAPDLTLTDVNLSQLGSPATVTVPLTSSSPSPGTYTRYTAVLQISGQPPTSSTSLASRSVPLTVYTDNTNIVRYCALQLGTSQICASLSATYNSTTGNCDFGPCNSGTVNSAYNCPSRPGATCSPPFYFWAFIEGTGSLTPICACTQECYTSQAQPNPIPTPVYVPTPVPVPTPMPTDTGNGGDDDDGGC